MRVLVPGHQFMLDVYDGQPESHSLLAFMQRTGEKYPGNKMAHPGTNMQEVLRALISRAHYLDMQIPCAETQGVIGLLRSAILLLELRAARQHGRQLDLREIEYVETRRTCRTCGHLHCAGHEAKQKPLYGGGDASID